jgi:hypothetical protein
MNSLSWFLYFAEVIPALGGTLAFLSFPVFAFWAIRAAMIGSEEYPFEGVSTGKASPMYGALVLSVGMLLFSTLIPSKETIYLIAGSQAGEAVVTSEAGQEILNDIHEVIKHQLGQLKAGESK